MTQIRQICTDNRNKTDHRGFDLNRRGMPRLYNVLHPTWNEALLTIMDAQGRQLRSITVTGTEGQKLIDLRDLDAGLYLYTLTTKSLTKSGKLIISR